MQWAILGKGSGFPTVGWEKAAVSESGRTVSGPGRCGVCEFCRSYNSLPMLKARGWATECFKALKRNREEIWGY